MTDPRFNPVLWLVAIIYCLAVLIGILFTFDFDPLAA